MSIFLSMLMRKSVYDISAQCLAEIAALVDRVPDCMLKRILLYRIID